MIDIPRHCITLVSQYGSLTKVRQHMRAFAKTHSFRRFVMLADGTVREYVATDTRPCGYEYRDYKPNQYRLTDPPLVAAAK